MDDLLTYNGFKPVRSLREIAGLIALVGVVPSAVVAHRIPAEGLSQDTVMLLSGLPYMLLIIFLVVAYRSLMDLFIVIMVMLIATGSYLLAAGLHDAAYTILAASLAALMPALAIHLPPVGDIDIARSRLTGLISALISAGIVWGISDMGITLTPAAAIVLAAIMLCFALAGLSRLRFLLVPVGILLVLAGLTDIHLSTALISGHNGAWGQLLLASAATLITVGHSLEAD